MKTKITFKFLLVITGLLLQLNLQAQLSRTIHVETAGTLPTLISSSEKYQITDLTLTGDLNGTDIRYIREMAGRDVDGYSTNGKLEVINLAEAKIVSGGDFYYVSPAQGFAYLTQNNAISDCMFSGCKITSITTPNNLILIGDNAFSECINLMSITIGNNVALIGHSAFYFCCSLTSVIIPNSVVFIGNYAFYCCGSLTSATIGNSVTSIGDSTFSFCTNLTSVTIGDGVTSIGNHAFADCGKLTSITIPNSVFSIGWNAFYYCTNLTSITIGNGVITIGDWAFENCTRLKEIHSKKSTPPYLGLGCLYDVDKTTCTLYVPMGAKSAYESDFGWKVFANIIEEGSTAIRPIDKNDIFVQSIPNGIVIEAKEKTLISVFNLSGQKLYQSVIYENAEIQLNKGVYIVRVNNESKKIIVK
ncbi:MAG: leucine-rich repeat domain-containing protein [Dysgonamonadaceae bacterium]|jgi:hypothetical protein|nr:leucine-rich repeat domain-containing protein [Dysgonamonadaceae bacterium]